MNIMFEELEHIHAEGEPVNYVCVSNESGHAMGNAIEFTTVEDAVYLADMIDGEYLSTTEILLDNVEIAKTDMANLVFLDRLRSDKEKTGLGTELLSKFEYYNSRAHDVTVIYGCIPNDKEPNERKEQYSSHEYLTNFYVKRGYEFIDTNHFYKVLH